jgi:uncharacterized protein with HEPN domain
MAATKNPRARLEHVLFHIRGVEDTIAGISYDTFRSVYYMERTVERAVAVVSEAVKALPIELLDKYPNEVWQKIISIGNFIRHEYERIRPRSHVGDRNRAFAGAGADHQENVGRSELTERA